MMILNYYGIDIWYKCPIPTQLFDYFLPQMNWNFLQCVLLIVCSTIKNGPRTTKNVIYCIDVTTQYIPSRVRSIVLVVPQVIFAILFRVPRNTNRGTITNVPCCTPYTSFISEMSEQLETIVWKQFNSKFPLDRYRNFFWACSTRGCQIDKMYSAVSKVYYFLLCARHRNNHSFGTLKFIIIT